MKGEGKRKRRGTRRGEGKEGGGEEGRKEKREEKREEKRKHHECPTIGHQLRILLSNDTRKNSATV